MAKSVKALDKARTLLSSLLLHLQEKYDMSKSEQFARTSRIGTTGTTGAHRVALTPLDPGPSTDYPYGNHPTARDERPHSKPRSSALNLANLSSLLTRISDVRVYAAMEELAQKNRAKYHGVWDANGEPRGLLGPVRARAQAQVVQMTLSTASVS